MNEQQKLRIDLLSMLEAADSLKTAEVSPRNGEINNIMQAVAFALEDLIDPEGRALAHVIIAEMRGRINALAADPESSGKHGEILAELKNENLQ